MKEEGIMFTSKASHPFSSLLYRPELDNNPMCDDQQIKYYQNLIGILRWVVEIGRIDILFEVSLLSRFQPRIGHLQQALNVFNYLKNYVRSHIVFDPRKIDIEWEVTDPEMSPWSRANAMSDLYPDATKDIPINAPEPRGRSA
eukprot:CAMPEP_0197842168 /NCGR_PEP_ID=MMETSP1437-20131217/46591_1 /TAXON_ID=49252 ORGANISM="Eucampia antarctica, Strain CCMP1452" /NCGR_SAMPLE_ID=MMETSP1437 /ASSEMBLY_ACC=CAM_ASM_001096 /LENGTH=142 /DNA_ID=CAMNT_0043452017 /DNA_START=162 /DNA_END=590 /DNA_ORIENTATION=-